MGRLTRSQPRFPCSFISVWAFFIMYSGYSGAQMKDFPNRQEGSWSQHASRDMQLIGLLRGPIKFGSTSTLAVRFYFPLPCEDIPAEQRQSCMTNSLQTLSVEARELDESRNYYMHSTQKGWRLGAWNSFAPWPASDVLVPLGVHDNNLAVLASYVASDGTNAYLPATVLSSGSTPPAALYTFQFTTSWDIHSIQKSLILPNGKTESLPLETCSFSPTCTLYDADSSHVFTLDFSNRSAGWYRVHLVGQIPNKAQRAELSVMLYHPGS